MEAKFCPYCSERMEFDTHTETWGCLGCECILYLTKPRVSATVRRGRVRRGTPVLRRNAVLRV
jgi:hypothetical protein